MKKIISMGIVLMMVLSITGCSNQGKIDKYLEEGDALLIQQDFNGANSKYQEARNIDENNKNVVLRNQIIERFNLAISEYGNGKIDKAKEYIVSEKVNEDYNISKPLVDYLEKELDKLSIKINEEIDAQIEKMQSQLDEKKYDDFENSLKDIKKLDVFNQNTSKILELEDKYNTSKNIEDSVEAIKGSSATDIKLSLVKWGLPEARAEESTAINGMLFNSHVTDSDTGAELRYYILANNNFEVVNASFSVANMSSIDKESFIGVSKGFLSYCATMPYDASEQATIKKWVEDNIASANKQGKVFTKTIGDAQFELFGNDNGGRFLTVKAKTH